MDRKALVGYSPRGHRVRHDWVAEHTHTIHLYLLPESPGKASSVTSVIAKSYWIACHAPVCFTSYQLLEDKYCVSFLLMYAGPSMVLSRTLWVPLSSLWLTCSSEPLFLFLFKTCSPQDWGASKKRGVIITKQDTMGHSQDKPSLHILCFSSSLKYIDNSIWCTVP